MSTTKYNYLQKRKTLCNISEGNVNFKYKDYADGNQQKEMALFVPEFLRRFKLHILPKRFVKIRHYGLLQNHGKVKRLNAIRAQLDIGALPPKVQIPVSQRMLEKYGKDITLCPKCNKGNWFGCVPVMRKMTV